MKNYKKLKKKNDKECTHVTSADSKRPKRQQRELASFVLANSQVETNAVVVSPNKMFKIGSKAPNRFHSFQ